MGRLTTRRQYQKSERREFEFVTEMERLARERLKPRAVELYQQQLEHRPERERYREYFLSKFGPDVLQKFNDRELLEEIPINLKNRGMDYTLEFKNDEDFRQTVFGSISGGAAMKYGVFRRQRERTWWTSQSDPASEQEALVVLRQRVTELQSACALLDSLGTTPVAQLDPRSFQEQMEKAAPNWHNSVWLHKYLHIYCPRLVTWNHSRGHLEAEVYRLGLMAHSNWSRYANDILALQFWSDLLQAPNLDVTPHWEKSWRNYWSFVVDSSNEAADCLRWGCVKSAPAAVGDLTDAYSFEKIREVETALKAELTLVEDSDDLDFLKWLGYMKPGEIVVLTDGQRVHAVGELEEAGYSYVPDDSKPHQRRVRWLHDQGFELEIPVEFGLHPISLKKHGLNVPLIEQSLLAYAGGVWPDYEPNITGQATPAPSPVTREETLKAPDDPVTRDILEILNRKGQVILYGPPGTGKTFFAEWAALECVARQNFGVSRIELTSSHRKRAFYPTSDQPVAYISTCTFHPAYSYEDFVEGYRPTPAGGFELRDGVFKRAARAAAVDSQNCYVVIIDEINRGNLPKIFGELITLIEYNKRGRTSVTLPVSGEIFTVPKNLFVIATMNTADRSILLLDTALRRRFGFLELMPQPERLQSSHLETPNLSSWLTALNRRIVRTLGRDGRNLQVGHAYFMDEGKPFHTLERLSLALRQEIWPLLQEYCYEDAQALGAILGSTPDGLYDAASDDLDWQLFKTSQKERLIAALSAIVEPQDTESQEAESTEDIEDI